EEIRQHDDERAAIEPIRRLADRPANVALTLSHQAIEHIDDPRELARPGVRRNPRLQLATKHANSDALCLAEHQVTQRDDESGCVVEFRFGFAAIRHRSAAIEKQHAAEVRFLIILLDVGAIGAGKDAPIEAPGFIAWRVEAVLTELDAGAFDGGTMLPDGVAFDNAARGDLELVQAFNECRVEETTDMGHFIIVSEIVCRAEPRGAALLTVIA